MKLRLLLLLVLAAAPCAEARQRSRAPRPAAAVKAAPAATTTSTLPIRRVILYSNGVAYIERRGTITGRAEINLSFKQSQVDDVLKSMIVLDLGEGRIGAVSYNSSAPPAARMADIPFSIAAGTRGEAGGGLAGVLGQLQGARVVVTTKSGRVASGSILTVEERRTPAGPDGQSRVTHALVLASEGGELSSFDLAEVRAVRLADEGARRDIGEFAAATASARRRDAKTITVTSDGAGAREMIVSYTIAAPIWKTTYRVVLDGQDGKPFFQGWAIVDNVSEEDWEGVQLSLISGTPVSFIQPIQKPFYRYRPVVPMPEDLQLRPQTHEPDSGELAANVITGEVKDPNGAAVTGATVTVTNEETGQSFVTNTNDEGSFRTQPLLAGNYTVRIEAPGFTRYEMQDVAVSHRRPSDVEVELRPAGVAETVTVTAEGGGGGGGRRFLPNSVNNLVLNTSETSVGRADSTISAAVAGGRSGVEAAAEGAEVGDLFEYQIARPVTVRRDRSALIPIVQTRMDGARVSVFNEASRRNRPMSGLLLKNTSRLTLEDGALTVIDGNAYAGESLMERLKPSEQRLVPFALDLGTLVTVRDAEETSPAFLVRIAEGTLYANYHNRARKLYTLTNQTDNPRTIYVEHPVREGWELDDRDTPKPEGKSARFYRFRVELGARESKQLTVSERSRAVETYAVSNITPDQLRLFVLHRYVDEPTRAALQNILDLKARAAAAAARVEQIDAEIAEIGADQKRLRENIEALNKTAEARQLIARYVAKADQQETRLEQLTREKQAAAAERQRLEAELNAAIRALSLERNLT